jgi:FkbH-like protein
LQDALRRGLLGAEEIEKAGQFVLRELSAGTREPRLPHVRVIAQCTSSWLRSSLAAVAWTHDTPCTVTEGGFDTVLQDVMALPERRDDVAPVLVLLPWHQRLLQRDGRSTVACVDDELQFWQLVWRAAALKGVARIIQVGYDWVVPGPRGFHLSGLEGGDVHVIGRLNEALRQELPTGSYFVPLDEISGLLGRSRFYDPRRFHWTRQPFSEEGTVLLAEHLFAALRAVTVGPRKVLALDLDNTIWGGVVGEVGPHGIALGESPDGEAYLAFQHYLKALAARGVLLAVCSKNNTDDAREPFEHNPHMILSLDDFVAFEANWEPKPRSLQRIAERLGLGLDSFVFFDDNPAEQEQVRQSLRDVAVVNAPADPAEFVRTLQNGLWFETVGLTREDEQRSAHYLVEARRRTAGEANATPEDYLRSLQMVGDLRPIDAADLPRVVQLLGKTNQFNLTTRRHGDEQVRELLSRDGALGITLRLADRFGDYGLVAVLIAVPLEEVRAGDRTLYVDTLLMSCRVIGRTAEHFLMRHLLLKAREHGYNRVIGEHIPTAKNGLVSTFYETMGFARQSELGGSAPSRFRYEVCPGDAALPESFVEPRG